LVVQINFSVGVAKRCNKSITLYTDFFRFSPLTIAANNQIKRVLVVSSSAGGNLDLPSLQCPFFALIALRPEIDKNPFTMTFPQIG